MAANDNTNNMLAQAIYALKGSIVTSNGGAANTANFANVAANANYANVAGSANDSNAIHKAVSNEINALTLKATPIANDVILIEDSANSYSKAYAKFSSFGGGGNMVYPAAGVPNSNGVGWLSSYTVGANANNLVQLDANKTLGNVLGMLPVIYKTANADSPLTADQCKKTLVNNYGMTDADCAINLPTAAEGYSFIAVLPAVRARFFKFRADTTDKIYLSGTAGSDNGYVGVASGYATATSAQFFTFKASDGGIDWFCIPIFGTWVAS